MNKKYTDDNIIPIILEECSLLAKKKFTPEYIELIEKDDSFIIELREGQRVLSFYNMLSDELSKTTFIKLVKQRYMFAFHREITGSIYKELLFSMFYPVINNFKYMAKLLYFYVIKKYKHPKEIELLPLFEVLLLNKYSIREIFDINNNNIIFDVNSSSFSNIYSINKKSISNYKIYVFQAENKNLERLKLLSEKYEFKNIELHNILLSSLEEEIKLLSQNKNVSTLDNFVRKNKIEKIDIITIDNSSNILHILEGAKNTIKKFRPKITISICLDININDVEQIKKIMPNYKYYLRAYSPFASSLVLYCIPLS